MSAESLARELFGVTDGRRREWHIRPRQAPSHAQAPTAAAAGARPATATSKPARRADPPRPVRGLIAAIKAGEISGSGLRIEDRQRCVEYLSVEGFSAAEIAEILGIADRTVSRDRVAIRERLALDPDPALARQIVGQFVLRAEESAGRLRRLSRDRETPAAVKVDAERSAWGVVRDSVQVMQRLGYLPTAPQRITGRIECEPPEPGVILEEIDQLTAALRDTDPSTVLQLAALRDGATRLQLSAQTAELARSAKGAGHER